jgi:pimeloyl-ACP methyl ester carboxylesterase
MGILSCGNGDLPREGFFTGNGGIQIFYKVVGAGSDTVVAIHGGPGGDMENIAPDLTPLAARHVVILLRPARWWPLGAPCRYQFTGGKGLR